MARRGLNRQKIIEAARIVANREGIERLTMRALSAEVGVEAASLYSHVRDKGDIYDGLAELVFSHVSIPPTDDVWPDRFVMYSDAMRAALLENANLISIVATRPIVSMATLELIENALTELADIGLSPDQAIFTLDTLIAFVIGHALSEIGSDPEIGGHDPELIASQRALLPAEQYPNLVQTLGQGPVDRDEEFAFGVRLLIDGVGAMLDRNAAT